MPLQLTTLEGVFFCARVLAGVMGLLREGRPSERLCQPVASATLLTGINGGGSVNTTSEGTIMTKLIPLRQRFIAGVSTRTVSARTLHQFLQVGRDFTTWIRQRIQQYGFEENQDYIRIFTKTGENSKPGRPRRDYYLTLDMAKELAMVERTDKGRGTHSTRQTTPAHRKRPHRQNHRRHRLQPRAHPGARNPAPQPRHTPAATPLAHRRSARHRAHRPGGRPMTQIFDMHSHAREYAEAHP